MGKKSLNVQIIKLILVEVNKKSKRNSINIFIPKFNTVKYGKNSYTGAKLWNILSNESKQARNIKALRRCIMSWNGPICSCFNCMHCSLKCM